MKFRFTAEQLMKMGFGPLGKSAKIATELNALLEAEEALCQRVTLLSTGRVLCVHTVLSQETCANCYTALLWNVEKLAGIE